MASKQLINGGDEGKHGVEFALTLSKNFVTRTKKELKELKENRPGAKTIQN